jgi:hypothetical protein
MHFFFWITFIYCINSFGLILWELLSRKTVEEHLRAQEQANKENKKELQPKDFHLYFSVTTLPPAVVPYPLTSVLTACLQGMLRGWNK